MSNLSCKKKWNVVKIGDVTLTTDYVANGSFASLRENVKYLPDPGYAILVRLADHTSGWNGKYVYVSEAAYNFLAKSSLYPGDIVVSNVGDPGKVFVVPDLGMPMTIGPNSILVRSLDENALHTPFLFHYLKSPIGQDSILKIVTSTAQRKFNKTSFRELDMPLPSLSEQRRIAAILDEADAIRRKRQQAINLADDFLRTTFLDMFGDPVTNPKGWEVAQLGSVCTKITDGEHLNPVFVDEGFPIIMANNVRTEGVVFDSVKFVSKEDFNKFTRKCKPERGDILVVSRGATIGRCTVVDIDRPFCLMGSTILLKIDRKSITSSFLNWLLQHPAYQAKLYKTSSASAQQAIYLSHVKDLAVLKPPMHIQFQFSTIVSASRKLLNGFSEATRQSNDLFSSLIQRAFRGEL